MKQVYSNEAFKESEELSGPKQETIDFLLNYSKALKVDDYQGMECEILLN